MTSDGIAQMRFEFLSLMPFSPLLKARVHSQASVHEVFEPVERTKDLKRAGKVLKGCAWVAAFHAPNRIDGGADTLGQGLLGQLSASVGYALLDPVQGAFNRQGYGMGWHSSSPKFERPNK